MIILRDVAVPWLRIGNILSDVQKKKKNVAAYLRIFTEVLYTYLGCQIPKIYFLEMTFLLCAFWLEVLMCIVWNSNNAILLKRK